MWDCLCTTRARVSDTAPGVGHMGDGGSDMNVGTTHLAAAILIGFAMLSAAVAFRKNDFESCSARYDRIAKATVPDDTVRAMYGIKACNGIWGQ